MYKPIEMKSNGLVHANKLNYMVRTLLLTRLTLELFIS